MGEGGWRKEGGWSYPQNKAVVDKATFGETGFGVGDRIHDHELSFVYIYLPYHRW